MFGKLVAGFAADVDCGLLDVDRSVSLGLTDSMGDENVYGECAEDVTWLIEFMWFSVGRHGENASRYYANVEDDLASHLTYLYAMTFRGIPTSEDRVRSMRGFNFLFGNLQVSRIGAILELGKYCPKYPGRKKKVNVAMARSPSDFASSNFRSPKVVPV